LGVGGEHAILTKHKPFLYSMYINFSMINTPFFIELVIQSKIVYILNGQI
jgi:hypothetical protein